MEEKEIILGRNPVLEYLRLPGDGRGHELYISENAHGKIISDIVTAAKTRGIKPDYRDRDFFSKISGSATHQGVALKISTREKKLQSDIIDLAIAASGVLVMLDHLTDPHNVGSIIRSAEALGAAGIAIPGSRSAGITPTTVKSSAGATAHVRIEIISNVATFLDAAKKRGLWIIGTSDRGDASFEKARTMKPCVLVIGNEGEGMKKLTMEKRDITVSIPLKGKISSLNASVAAGIALYELLK